jgi:hypothetical protein
MAQVVAHERVEEIAGLDTANIGYQPQIGERTAAQFDGTLECASAKRAISVKSHEILVVAVVVRTDSQLSPMPLLGVLGG